MNAFGCKTNAIAVKQMATPVDQLLGKIRGVCFFCRSDFLIATFPSNKRGACTAGGVCKSLNPHLSPFGKGGFLR
jgi:hypothetical protein